MIYENTGFYLDNNMKLREAARSIDTESRATGIEALKPLVADAPVILTQNVSPVLLVANGSPGKLHSLIFLDEQDRKIATKIMNDAPRGTRELLPKPPDYVLIALNAKILDAIQKNELLNINHLFADVAKDDFLVALPYTHDRYCKNKLKFGTEASTSTIKYDKFNYDLGYAVTAYKLQGATLDNVLIDLNQRPQGLKAMDLRALYVILSRVATMEKIKIMPFRNHPQKVMDFSIFRD